MNRPTPTMPCAPSAPPGDAPRTPAAIGLHDFDTRLGTCTIVWSALGVLSLQLPERSVALTRARAMRGLRTAEVGGAAAGWGTAPPPDEIRAAIDGVIALFEGEPRHLREVVLDWRRTPPFHRRVYERARAIEPGDTLTYGEIARDLGEPGAARAVGQALGSNPFVVIVPCHRVLAAGDRPGGFSAPGGLRTKERLLAFEGRFSKAPAPGDTYPLF